MTNGGLGREHASLRFASDQLHFPQNASLQHAAREDSGNWEYNNQIYTQIGYVLVGDRAERPARINPYP